MEVMKLNTLIKTLRLKKGMSQMELEEKSQIPQTQISLMESGKRRVPDKVITMLSEIFTVDTEYFYYAQVRHKLKPATLNKRLQKAFSKADENFNAFIESYA